VPELKDLLEDAAPRTRGPVPIDEIVRRGRRRSTATRVASATVVLVALVAALNLTLTPSPTPRPVVDQPSSEGPVEVDGEVVMRAGFDGPVADRMAQRLDPTALPGTAEVLTWSDSGLGRVAVVRYRTDGGEVTWEEDGERYSETTGPYCVAITPFEGSAEPTCDSVPVDLGMWDLGRGVEFLGFLGAARGCPGRGTLGLRVRGDIDEVVVSVDDGGSIAVRPHAGLVYLAYPGAWWGAISAALYDDGRLVDTVDVLPEMNIAMSSTPDPTCLAAARIAATPGSASITVDGTRQERLVADHVRTLRWPTRPGDELRVELLSLSEEVGVVLRVPFPDGDPNRARVELRLPTVGDPSEPQPTFTASGDACQVDLAEATERTVRGRIQCELVSETDGTITARLELEVTAPEEG
jgi:hypothetical protein